MKVIEGHIAYLWKRISGQGRITDRAINIVQRYCEIAILKTV